MGNFLWRCLGQTFMQANNKVDFRKLFLVPAGIAVAAAPMLLLFFHPPEKAGVEKKDLVLAGD